MALKRKYPIGAEIIPDKGVHFRVWAPNHKKVDLVLEEEGSEPQMIKMVKEKNGYFSLLTKKAKERSYYRFRLSNGSIWYPDPASRCQPHGSAGPSCVVDSGFPWKDKKWPGVKPQGHIVYEIHIGTFTQDGTFIAASKELERLADLGITLIEIMPINSFPGHFGWGYDGVNLFAPTYLYGSINDVKEFIDKAHSLGMGVILDVVYNHFGPEDNSLTQFASDYLNKDRKTDWGDAINFDVLPSREFFITNAHYWIEEYHFDGLRFDATPWLLCSTKMHILEELTRTVKKAGGKRHTISIGENEPQDTKLLRPYDEGGYGFDMLWNDDFHHSAYVRLTGKREAYYTDYLGSPQEFISLIKYGFLYQGQYYSWQKKERGAAHFSLPHHNLMIFLENHDQVANSGHGLRLHKKSDPGNYKAMVSLLLLSPNTPLIFQGQEFDSDRPFHYFSDHSTDLASLVSKGRKDELAQFPRLATYEVREVIPNPENPLTFVDCKLNMNEINTHFRTYQFYKDLIHLRKNDPVFKNMQNLKIDGAVLGSDSFVLRYFGEEEDRLLIINFGPDQNLIPGPEPLLAAGIDQKFELLWSSESLIYGGEGTPPITIPFWKILGHSAIVLKTKPSKKRSQQ